MNDTIRQFPQSKTDGDDGDNTRRLALVIRDGLLMIVRGIETIYHIKAKHDCPKCGWRS
jgi:hypothetical protein